MSFVAKPVAIAALWLFVATGATGADEKNVPLDKVPQAVSGAVKDRFAGAKLVGAETETEEGKTVYEIAIEHKGQSIEVTLTTDGKIIEIEKQIAAKDMPKVVSEALDGKYPQATYKTIEEV